jgi:hypothetical protein
LEAIPGTVADPGRTDLKEQKSSPQGKLLNWMARFWMSTEPTFMIYEFCYATEATDSSTGSLRRLRTIPLRWIRSFHKNDPTSSEYEEEIPLQILGDLKIVTREEDISKRRK